MVCVTSIHVCLCVCAARTRARRKDGQDDDADMMSDFSDDPNADAMGTTRGVTHVSSASWGLFAVYDERGLRVSQRLIEGQAPC